MSCKYLITLTPAGRFFFGGAAGFSDGFFVQSEKFPQPTTVLGALRASLLVGSNMLLQHKRGRFVPKNKKKEAEELTGTSRINNFEETPDLGVIKNISPVFIVKKEEGKIADAFFKAPEDIVKNKETGKFRKIVFNKVENILSCNCPNSGKREFLYQSDFNIKDEKRGEFYGGLKFWENYLKDNCSGDGPLDLDDEESPFKGFTQTGVGLKKREVEEGKLYVKNDFQLKKGYSFALICNLDLEPNALKLSENILLGGEQSVFLIQKTKLDDEKKLASHPVIELIINKMEQKKEKSNVCMKKSIDAQKQGVIKSILVSPMVLPKNTAIFKEMEHAIIKRISNVRMLNSFNTKDNS